MKQFVWRLQRVLDIKIKEEQAKQTELFQLTEKLAHTRGKLLRQQQILKDIIRKVSERRSIERSDKGPSSSLSEQEFLLRHTITNDAEIERLKNKVSKLESQQRQKIAEVLKVRQFKEGLEKLRTTAKKEFLKEQEKLEQKELDEGATFSYARKTVVK
jgi:flagellar export protein FliJ